MDKKVARSKRLMKANRDSSTVWSEMPHDLLLRIFAMLSLVDRLTSAAAVCRSWRDAVSVPLLLDDKLDLSEYDLSVPPTRRREILRVAFTRGINLSLGNFRTLIFNSSLQLMDDQLLYAASRSSNLRELVFPVMYNIAKFERLGKVFKNWSKLESLTLGLHIGQQNLIKIIGRNCPNLKFFNICIQTLNQRIAAGIVSKMPRIKVLKIHCSSRTFYSVQFLRWNLPELEEFRIFIGNLQTMYKRISDVHWDIHVGPVEEGEAEFPMHHVVCTD